MSTVQPTLADLFCGAGGLSLGFLRAGFHIVYAADSWSPAVQTYRQIVRDDVAQTDVTPDIALPDCAVIAGGPPCQGFSSAGRRRGEDERNSLVAIFAQAVARHRPRAFVFENVEGFLTLDGGRFVLELLEPLVRAGYRIHLRKVNAANYGVPQHRKRVIAVGGLGWDPTFPEPTHRAYGAPGATRAARALPPTPSVHEALDGLPPAVLQEPGMPVDHVARPMTGVDLERARGLGPGKRMRDLPPELWHSSYRRRAFRRVCDGTPTERRGGAPAGLLRLRNDEPAKAITSGALREFLHPTEQRPLTIRECARLQTFQDTDCFAGSRAERMRLIGNAVPPRLAEAIARALYADLCTVACGSAPGALLSFATTASEGVSPALAAVERLVGERFQRPRVRESQAVLWD